MFGAQKTLLGKLGGLLGLMGAIFSSLLYLHLLPLLNLLNQNSDFLVHQYTTYYNIISSRKNIFS